MAVTVNASGGFTKNKKPFDKQFNIVPCTYDKLGRPQTFIGNEYFGSLSPDFPQLSSLSMVDANESSGRSCTVKLINGFIFKLRFTYLEKTYDKVIVVSENPYDYNTNAVGYNLNKRYGYTQEKSYIEKDEGNNAYPPKQYPNNSNIASYLNYSPMSEKAKEYYNTIRIPLSLQPSQQALGYYSESITQKQFDPGKWQSIFSWTTDIVPTFNLNDWESVKNYIDSGDASGSIYTGKKGTDWTVFIDGAKNPLLNIVWKNPYLDYSKKKIFYNLARCKFWHMSDKHGKVELGSFLYTSGSFKTSYLNLLKKSEPEIYNSVINGVVSQFADYPLNITFQTEWTDNDGEFKTSKCYFIITPRSGITNYGVLNDPQNDESTVTIDKGTGETEDDYDKYPDDSDIGKDSESGDGGTSAIGLFSTTYAMTVERLKALGGFLWGSFIDSIKLVNNDPIENVVSCKIVPCSVSGTDKPVILGNVDTGVNGGVVGKNIKLKIGTISVRGTYNSFLDYAPFTKLTLFLPFIGFKELDTSLYMGKSLSVEYIIDLITGSCKSMLFANGIYCQSFDGSCGIDIPLTASNRAKVESSYIQGAIGTVGSMVSGDALGAMGTALNTAMTGYHYNTNGTYNPSCGAFETRMCYIIVDRPTFQLPTTYAHNKGLPCQLSRSLSSVSGFTVCASGVDLSGIDCTEEEREDIRRKLTSGVYL